MNFDVLEQIKARNSVICSPFVLIFGSGFYPAFVER